MQVLVFEWGEPVIKNVIHINYETRKMQLQTPDHFGSYWTSFDKALSQYQIDYYFICLAAAEINRLQIKSTILENEKKRKKRRKNPLLR